MRKNGSLAKNQTLVLEFIPVNDCCSWLHGILIDTFIRLSALLQQKRYWFQNQDVNLNSFISAPIFILFPLTLKLFYLKESDDNNNSINYYSFHLQSTTTITTDTELTSYCPSIRSPLTVLIIVLASSLLIRTKIKSIQINSIPIQKQINFK